MSNDSNPVAGVSLRDLAKQALAVILSAALLFAALPLSLSAAQDAQAPVQAQDQSSAQSGQPAQPQGPPYAQKSPEELQQLVAPIALYPDSLVAQILAASTFPEEVVEADRFVQDHPDLKGDALAQAVDQENWDPSVKALTAFPSVLGNMDKNLSWTSSLGDADYNQEQDVMDAVQVMRKKAETAGNLKSTSRQSVSVDGYGDVDIAPVDPEIVYVPEYDPWLAYGYPVMAWPGWYPYPGIWYDGPSLYFGVGFGVGFFGGFGWGWPHWGFDWHNHSVMYNRGRYSSHSVVFYNRNAFYRGGARGGVRGGARVFNRPGVGARPFEGDRRAARGFAAPHGQSGIRSGAFSHYDHGGESRSYSSRGAASFGGGARGGGGFHGGGGHGGGRH